MGQGGPGGPPYIRNRLLTAASPVIKATVIITGANEDPKRSVIRIAAVVRIRFVAVVGRIIGRRRRTRGTHPGRALLLHCHLLVITWLDVAECLRRAVGDDRNRGLDAEG